MTRHMVLPAAAPQEYNIEIGDLVLFCCDEDQGDAEDFIEDLLEKMRNEGQDVVGYLSTELENQGTEFQSVEKICKMCVQKWFYVTETFLRDEKMLFHKDEQIMKSLKTHGTFVPVFTKPKDDFEDLPYGMMAYRGMYTDDEYLVRSLSRMFGKNDHKLTKKRLKEKQQDGKKKWMAEEQLKRQKEQEEADREHERRMKEISERRSYGRPPAYMATPRANEGQMNAGDDDVENEIPRHLLASLESARSSVSPTSARKVTYNITINQPGNVTIGNTTAAGREGEDSILKNITSDATNPRMDLNDALFEAGRESPGRPVAGTSGRDPHNSSSGSSGEFEKLDPPVQMEEN